MPQKGHLMFPMPRAMAAIAILVLAACATGPVAGPSAAAPPAAATGSRYVAIPADKDTDLKLSRADGRIASGKEALGAMQREAQVVLWLAGNQFFAMDDVVRAF